MSDFGALIQSVREVAQCANHRQLVRVIGSVEWATELARSIVANQPYFWIGKAPQGVFSSQYQRLLGRECDLLIVNALDGFDANAFSAAEGTLKGGGILVLLTPESIDINDHFYHYIQSQLKHFSFVTFEQNKPVNYPPLQAIHHKPVHPLNLDQQQIAVQAIIKTVTGHRRRPLVLTANRGRGKSAALGIAAKQLVQSGLKTILICAPNKQATTTLFKHAGESKNITFIAPDLLLETKPTCDLLIIDEAAALPVPMLEALAIHYSRLVFSTTLHGYEGSGRGFALRFQARLKEIAPEYRAIHLDQPIRWAKNDPLESFTLSSLCLTETQTRSPQYDKNQPVVFDKINATTLLENKALLAELFSLLVTAHYQTKPSDLEMLLNDPLQHVFILSQNSRLLGVALVNEEGAIDESLAIKIYHGERRLKGHLIAQSLTFHCAQQQAATHQYARIQRIAIHPAIQQHGLGNLFIDKISTWAKTMFFDHLCCAFGATNELLNFWHKNQFSTLRIGNSKDKSSGTHSFIMNIPISEKGNALHLLIQAQFQQQLCIQTSRHLQSLDPAIMLSLLKELPKKHYQHPLIDSYCTGDLPYEFAEYHLLQLLTNSELPCLDAKQSRLCIQKILQNKSWAEICSHNEYTGKKQAQQALRYSMKLIVDLAGNKT